MKNITFFLFISINILCAQNSIDTIIQLNEVIATYKATQITPVNYQNISFAEINQKSVGQEPAILISTTPSITYSVDGGHSQGYSYFRLRGLDQTRVNITINGVPLNDPMDQAFYFSNFADILNSTDEIQIQRGVGLTKNGSASYAGSIELFSKKLSDSQKLDVGLGYGSFNTFRSYVSFNSSIQNNKALYVRVSKINTDGFKQHASNKSNSIFLSGGLFLEKSIWKLNFLGGSQKNGLAWMAVPEIDINCDRTINSNSEYEEDDFMQLITQIQNTYTISSNNTIKTSFYYTIADGWWHFDIDNYYDINSKEMNLSKNEINSHLVGCFSNYEHVGNNFKLVFGMHANTYKNEFTESDVNSGSVFYNIDRLKAELSGFGKIDFQINKLLLATDLQFRNTTFDYKGDIMKFKKISWNFLNPKFGVSYEFSNDGVLYASVARIGREPAKYDMFQGNDVLSYVDGALDWNTYEYIGPEYGNDLISTKPEFVNDIELGVRKIFQKGSININYFYMDFENERVLNGQTGPNGLALRSIVDNSTRTGIEFFGEISVHKNLKFTNNSSFNYSKIQQESIEFKPILTPKFIVNQELSYSINNFTFNLSGRYQSESYMNFENSESLDDYIILNSSIDYKIKNYYVSVFINNLTDNYYFNNGEVNDNGTRSYWVQAPRNLYISLKYTF